MKQTQNYFRAAIVSVALLSIPFSALTRADGTAAPPSIRVSGEGSVMLAPDMAILELAVMREAKTARAALDANSSAMADVLSAMKKQGVVERDLQTSAFSIQPNYIYPKPKASGEREPPRIVGYRVRNKLTVRVRDIQRVGSILDESVTLGVNEGGNIRFVNDDPSAAITAARIKAVKEAVAKAGTLAEAAGVKAGRLLEISEQSYAPRPMPMARAEMMSGMSADAVPVAAGENAYKVTVNVTFAIDQ
jgi:uncharacterized protein YggE